MKDVNTPVNGAGRLKLQEKVGYALGDVASNFYWRVFDIFLLIFYTDVFGLPAGAVGTMLLVTRVIDAVSDPVMGMMADRTRHRFGRFRPYLLWGALPLAAAGVLTFTVPNLGDTGNLIWAYGTYISMMLAYTFINIPYGALLGVVTSNSQDRTTLTSFRFLGAFSGGSLVAYWTPELVVLFGNGDETQGWQLTMALYGAIAMVLFVLTFLSTKERIEPMDSVQAPVKQDLTDLINNKPWLILFGLALIIMLTISLRASTGTFYFKYYVERPDLIGSFSLTYLLSLLAGAAMTPLLTRYFDKRTLLVGLMTLVAVLSAAFFFIPPDQIAFMFVLQAAVGLCLGPKSPLVYSMYADTADYSEWRTGRRSTALVFSAATFSQKLGGALAGAGIGWVLAYLGYVANEAQAAPAQMGIVLLMTIVPGVFSLIAVVCIYFYPLTEAQVLSINTELDKRREKFQGAKGD